MIKRDLYLNQLYDYIDKPFIKVITGIRRSGKSAILMLLRNELLIKGIEGKNIIYINFESFEYSDIDKADKLYMFIKAKITNKQRYYIPVSYTHLRAHETRHDLVCRLLLEKKKKKKQKK